MKVLALLSLLRGVASLHKIENKIFDFSENW